MSDRQGRGALGLKRGWRWLAGLCLLAGLAACDLEFTDQEVRIRARPGNDRAEVLFLCKGLTTPKVDDESIEKGVRAVEALLQGRRQFMIVNWPLFLDLEGMVEDARKQIQEARDGELDPKRARKVRRAQYLLAIEEHVEVKSTGLFLDDEERLCGYQQVEITKLGDVMGFVNWIISDLVLEELQEDAERGTSSFGDAETARLTRAKVTEQTPWITLEDGALAVEVPMSAAQARELRREALQELVDVDDDDDRWFASVAVEALALAEEISFDGAALRMVLRGEDGLLELCPSNPELKYDHGLRDALLSRGLKPDASMTVGRAREIVR